MPGIPLASLVSGRIRLLFRPILTLAIGLLANLTIPVVDGDLGAHRLLDRFSSLAKLVLVLMVQVGVEYSFDIATLHHGVAHDRMVAAPIDAFETGV